MYIDSKIDKVNFKDCDSFDNHGKEEIEKMFDYCESLIKDKEMYDLDSIIYDLEVEGNTHAKRWQLNCANYFASSKDCYNELMIVFANGFYACFEPCYYIEGKI